MNLCMSSIQLLLVNLFLVLILTLGSQFASLVKIFFQPDSFFQETHSNKAKKLKKNHDFITIFSLLRKLSSVESRETIFCSRFQESNNGKYKNKQNSISTGNAICANKGLSNLPLFNAKKTNFTESTD